jgi:hypothetical protein
MIRPRRLFDAGRWCAALVVLASILGDLVDTRCHLASDVAASNAVMTSAGRQAADPCEGSDGACVPHCFCCCARMQADNATLVAEALRVPEIAPSIASSVPLDGVTPVLYHPPLAQA